ncbi:MAG: protein translocase subunit SecD, partial [Patescibacteria group bacterium]
FGRSLIRGFALSLAICVLASMFTAITVTRTILNSFGFKGTSKTLKFLFGHGFKL